MFISIITINFNNLSGLEKTLDSVASQTCKMFEHLIIDGGSTDGSKEFIEGYANNASYKVNWVSEKDSGIYNAMNKGIKLAKGEYVQILNSGDCLANMDVIRLICNAVEQYKYPDFLFGNLIKVWPDGLKLRPLKRREGECNLSFFDFYNATLDHDGALIKRSLYDRFGLYDEGLKICSDWEWVLNAVVFNNITPIYFDVDTILFDMSGVSECDGKNRELIKYERRHILESLLPKTILCDYDSHYVDICMMKRIHKCKLFYKFVWLMDRVIFKFEKIMMRKQCYFR